MPKLYRPSIPIEVKCQVLLRQIGELFPEDVLAAAKKSRTLGRLHGALAINLAVLLNCDVSELQLDHDPALALRTRTGEGKATVYDPIANDPEFLAYRPHGAQHAASHDVKTRLRGDHGQFSDIALIKRERRREKKAAAGQTPKMRTANGFAKTKQKIRSGKPAWPKRKFQKPQPRRKP